MPDEMEKKEVTNRSLPTLFINKLPSSINEAGLRNLFRDFGDIRNVYIHRTWGTDTIGTTNWAKVSFAKKQEAIEAIREVNGKPPLYLHVKFALDRDEDAKPSPRGEIEMERNFGEEFSKMMAKVWESNVNDYEWPSSDQLVVKVDEPMSIDTDKIKKLSEIDEDYKRMNDETSPSQDPTSTDSETTGDDTSTADTLEDYKRMNDETSPSQDPTSSTDSETTGDDTSTADTPARSFTFGNPLLVPYMAPLPCEQCSKSGRIVCSRCHAWYCSQACQVNNWTTHRDQCRQVQKE